MARYKPYDYAQTHLIPVSLEHQLLPGTLEHAIHEVVEQKLDLSLFDAHYQNDETGCRAYDPKILLKVVLFAYARGVVGSRRIEWLCRHQVTCMALACMQHPDHSTIAAFVSSRHAEILTLFGEGLLVCEERQLLGGTVFALDGLKLSSNASKEWSGTLEELRHKQAKLEAKLAQLLAEHQQVDAQGPSDEEPEAGLTVVAAPDRERHGAESVVVDEHEGGYPEAQPAEEAVPPEVVAEMEPTAAASPATDGQFPTGTRRRSGGGPKRSGKATARSRQQRQQQKRARRLKRLRHQAERLKTWLASHGPRMGRQGNEIQSNIIDPESAKMPTSHGVVQGYNAQALVDDAYQVIVAAEVFGDGQDAQHLTRIMDRAKATMQGIGHGADYFAGTTVLADSNYFSDENLQTCEEEQLDAYIPDGNFRKRDPRFANQARYKPKKKNTKKKRFGVEDFTFDEATQGYRCPNGALLRLKAREHRVRHRVYRYYAADEQDCQACQVRATCLSQKRTRCKHLGIPVEDPVTKPKSRCQQMIEKINTPEGRQRYSRRLPIVEPVFANLRTQKGLDHFTLRGKEKVDSQWLLYAMVHNIEKIAHYGTL
jgi:transposase